MVLHYLKTEQEVQLLNCSFVISPSRRVTFKTRINIKNYLNIKIV